MILYFFLSFFPLIQWADRRYRTGYITGKNRLFKQGGIYSCKYCCDFFVCSQTYIGFLLFTNNTLHTADIYIVTVLFLSLSMLVMKVSYTYFAAEFLKFQI